MQVAEHWEGWQLLRAGHMDFKKGWIILDSITHISCHMYRHSKVPLHHVLILHQKPGGFQGDRRSLSQWWCWTQGRDSPVIPWFSGKPYSNTCCNKHYQVFILNLQIYQIFSSRPSKNVGPYGERPSKYPICEGLG